MITPPPKPLQEGPIILRSGVRLPFRGVSDMLLATCNNLAATYSKRPKRDSIPLSFDITLSDFRRELHFLLLSWPRYIAVLLLSGLLFRL